MNNEEKKAFEKCMKEIKRLIIQERQTKAKLERIQNDKIKCLKALIDDDYCEKILKGSEDDEC